VRRLAFSTLVLVAALVPARVEAQSRLYPYAGVAVRFQFNDAATPKRYTLAQAGVALSLGKLAPSVTVRGGVGHAEVEVGLRYVLR
jgi:hypothetical protein